MPVVEKPDDYVSKGSDGSLSKPGEVNTSRVQSLLIFVHLISKACLPDTFDIESALVDADITTFMTLSIIEHNNREEYLLAIAPSCVSLLSTRLRGFTVILVQNHLAPADYMTRVHEIIEVKKRALNNAVTIAQKTESEKWTPDVIECYRKAFEKTGQKQELNENVLNRDFQVSYQDASIYLRLLTFIRETTHIFLISLSMKKAYHWHCWWLV